MSHHQQSLINAKLNVKGYLNEAFDVLREVGLREYMTKDKTITPAVIEIAKMIQADVHFEKSQ